MSLSFLTPYYHEDETLFLRNVRRDQLIRWHMGSDKWEKLAPEHVDNDVKIDLSKKPLPYVKPPTATCPVFCSAHDCNVKQSDQKQGFMSCAKNCPGASYCSKACRDKHAAAHSELCGTTKRYYWPSEEDLGDYWLQFNAFMERKKYRKVLIGRTAEAFGKEGPGAWMYNMTCHGPNDLLVDARVLSDEVLQYIFDKSIYITPRNPMFADPRTMTDQAKELQRQMWSYKPLHKILVVESSLPSRYDGAVMYLRTAVIDMALEETNYVKKNADRIVSETREKLRKEGIAGREAFFKDLEEKEAKKKAEAENKTGAKPKRRILRGTRQKKT